MEPPPREGPLPGGEARAQGPPSPESLFLENLRLIEEVARIVGRRRRFTTDEAEEFVATVRMRFVEGDYRILRSFRGASSLRTYLVTVVQRLALDFVIHETGKWRPSARARRLGDLAMRLEELLVRDRLSPEEACRRLVGQAGVSAGREEILALAREIPVRIRPRLVPVEEAEGGPVVDPRSPASDYEAREVHARRAAAIERVFRDVMGSLPAEDRLLLKLRYEGGLTVQQIAPLLGATPKRLYKRTDRILEKLRRALEGAGLAPSGGEETSLTARFLSLWLGEEPGGEIGIGPSNRVNGSAPAARAGEETAP